MSSTVHPTQLSPSLTDKRVLLVSLFFFLPLASPPHRGGGLGAEAEHEGELEVAVGGRWGAAGVWGGRPGDGSGGRIARVREKK
uniref:Uncharacterized protein n=1 Tax=Setaria viridis TaxID=4556 RepID=A0A4U6U0B0_SETVI|nr:hypothetical protein SEVIR_6G050850v2 [Setaria viridis]